MKESPHRSGEHRQPQRPRTLSCGNTGLPGGFPAPHGRGGSACGAQRLVDQEGKPRRHLVRDETGAIREPHRPHRLDHPDHPGGVPLHHRQPRGLRRPDRRRPGGGAAPLRGDRHGLKVQGTVTAVDQAGAKSAFTGPWASAGTPCTGPGAGLEIENKGPGRGPGK